jgi:HipA-like protein
MYFKDLIGVAVYLKKRKTRILVGKLYKDNSNFIFEYDTKYLYAKNIIPIGVELPLTKKKHRSKTLFPSFQDRIPSKENPAYAEYCISEGISKDEKDPFILLVTIGKKGPSSFVFEPIFRDRLSGKDIKNYRKWLNLTIREFSNCFEISKSSLIRIEKDNFLGKELMKRIEIYIKFPKVALEQIYRKGGCLSDEKREYIIKKLKEKVSQKK